MRLLAANHPAKGFAVRLGMRKRVSPDPLQETVVGLSWRHMARQRQRNRRGGCLGGETFRQERRRPGHEPETAGLRN